MAEKYTNKNTRVADEGILLIHSQFSAINEQKKILDKSKVNILKSFKIGKANYYLRLNSLKQRGLLK